ncbi:glycosyltransferase [Bacillus sp. ISL-40]|uniref:glycosyltransferase n=1 Tax=unclassified Bacillus (in: firmicutes) TaxID=185979 RepID=UPI001BEACA69|nr:MULTISPECIES: glycosyltransferase [unclassified Bacillus (in: firmicutes)]MBT2699823.1 glycosyltransferase [Bacillus sp. ISL-40]MBT2721937.1 glycosyltransferase [Bacillus sp. ISL-46]MBT2743286.1 glycosyltransferase [Bacillus sp. ISL-77]
MVSIITCTIREENIKNVFKNYKQQSWKDKELIIILNKDSMNIDRWIKKAKKYRNVQVYQLHEKATLGDCLNFGIMKASHDIIAKFDDDDYYGPDYIKSSMDAFKNKDISIIGKSSLYIYFKSEKALIHVAGSENSITETVAGATLIFRKDVFQQVQFEKVNRAEDYFFIDQCKEKGFNVYSTERFHFAVIRHDTEKHTWKIADKDLMEWGELITYTEDFQSLVSKKAAI